MHVFTKIATQEQLAPYIQQVQQHWQQHVQDDPESWEEWSARTVDVTADPIVEHARDIIESKLRIRLICHQALVQIWPMGVRLGLHCHATNSYGQKWQSVYNSLLYLNQDFHGGEFMTEEGIRIEPRVGTLTLFNGRDVLHGATPFYGNHRYTIIFWWSDKSHWLDEDPAQASSPNVIWA